MITAKCTLKDPDELEYAKKWLKILQYLLEGKTVVLDDPYVNNKRIPEEYTAFNELYNIVSLDEVEFLRVDKPKEYAPFTFEDASKLIGKSIKHKLTENMWFIYHCTTGGVNGNISYIEAFNDYTFLDGSPFGKIKQ